MKKIIIILTIISLTTIIVTPTYAGHYFRYHHGWHRGPHGPWGAFAFGLGILTGAVVSSVFYGPPAPRVIVQPAPAFVVQPAPVVVQEPPAALQSPAIMGGRVSVTAHTLNVRSGPGMNFPVIHQIYQGNILVIHGYAPGWLYVKLPSGHFGWVMAKFTTQTLPPASG